MIPGGDHSSRSLLFRRICSWSEVANRTSMPENNDNTNRNRNRNRNDDEADYHIHRRPLLQLTSSIIIDDVGGGNNENENSNGNSNGNDNDDDDDLTSPLLQLQQVPSLEYEEQSHQSQSSATGGNDEIFRRQQSCSATITSTDWKLWIVFGFLVASGVGNVIFAKLQSLPMYNYPTFLNIYANGVYVLMSFAYILPVYTLGLFGNSIPRAIPSRAIKPFFIMGGLDALGAAMQVLATVYLPGTLLVLIPQVAIPLSMAAGSLVLREKYTIRQYAGAVVVFFGILVVLFPILSHQRDADYYCEAIDTDNDCVVCQVETTKEECLSHNAKDDNANHHNFTQQQQQQLWRQLWRNSEFANDMTTYNTADDDDDYDFYCAWVSKEEASTRNEDFLVFFWSIVMLLSCVPSVMSTVYKQVALQTASSMDPILINGWVSLFQFLCGFFLVVPSGLVSSPRVHPLEIGSNWLDGIGCLFAQTNSIESGCHPDDCSRAALWVHVSLVNSVVYALSMLFVLKYGSCDLMYLGLTLVVPLGHLAFDFHSSFSELRAYDIAGLMILVAGLVLYRFGHVGKQQMDDETTRTRRDGNGHDRSGHHPYEAMVDGENEVGLENAVSSINLHAASQRSTTTTTTENTNTNTNASTAIMNHDKDGFLEFLREPFMLIGDI